MQGTQVAPVTPTPPQGLLPPPTAAGQAQVSVEGLLAQRMELERQLRDLNDRRRDLQRQRSQAGDAEAKSLEGRLAVMDAQTVKIEGLLATVNERYATAIALNPEAARLRFAPGGTLDNNVRRQIENAAMDGTLQGLSIAGFSLLGVFVLWRGLRRFVFRRKPKVTSTPAIPDNTIQIQNLQQSMDAIAIEVERISEAQRFSAKLLKEKVRVE